MKRALLICFAILTSVLGGCVSPRTPAPKCTIVMEEQEGLYFQRTVWEVERFEDATVSIGVPTGMRIESVNYEDYSVSQRTGSSESYDYYTLTLHQVRYSQRIRLTTAPSYTTAYHPNGGEGDVIQVQEDSPHLYFNTLPWQESFRRDGYVPIGWNTEPDGSGQAVGFGSRIDHRDQSHLDLYLQWIPATPEACFTWTEGDDGVTVTGYSVSENVVIPMTLGGQRVTGIASGSFGSLTGDVLILPPSLRRVEPGAFGSVTVEHLYFFDTVSGLDEQTFSAYSIGHIHIQAASAPVYSGSYFDTLADKMDYLDSLADRQKIVLFCGSSARFGYDSGMLESAFPDYRVANMGVYAYTNMLPLAELVLQRVSTGDLLLSSPELDAIDKQFCGETDLDKETFCMMESNYDLFAGLNSRNYTNIFGAYGEFSRSREKMTPRDYSQSPSDYDEDGAPVLTPSYNQQGDYILYRENNLSGRTFGVKRAYYNRDHIRQTDLEGLNRVYDAFAGAGVRVLFTYSPRSRISISPDSTEAAIQELDAYLRDALHAQFISPIEHSLMDPLYFYGTDNHLSTEGVSIHTERIIQDLRAVLASSADQGGAP